LILNPEPGDFQLAPTGGLGGKLIQFGQWLNGDGFADFEHVRLYVGPSQRQGYGKFIQAEPHGAELAEFPLNLGAWSTGLLGISPDTGAVIAMTAYGYRGTPYGFLDYGALAAHRLHIPVPGLKNFMASDKTMICSQLVAQCYLKAGVVLFPGDEPGDVTPGDLYQLLVSKGLKQ
jgi:hypothetical protein